MKVIFYFALCLLFTFPVFAANIPIHDTSDHVSANPAAVNIFTGTGNAQAYIEEKLGIKDNHGLRIGGALLGDVNNLFSGGVPDAKRWTANSLLLLSFSLDTEKAIGWKDGLLDLDLLQFNGGNTNGQAGSVQGYNSLPGPSPLNRSEIYQLWFRQTLFDKKFIFRIGKLVPTFNFNNVSKPVPLEENKLMIPAVTGLLYTPIFVNASMLGVLPGYYNSAYGINLTLAPTTHWYLSYGGFDGNLAQGVQTGLTGPHFNGAYFHIAETGVNWLLGKNKMPGDFAVGAWRQTGLILNGNMPGLSEHGTTGYYLFGTQRLWYKDRSQNDSGISGFYQYGKNQSHVLSMTQYIGAGLTAFGLVPNRLNDSIGIGGAYSWLNQTIFSRQSELIIQAYYQTKVMNGVYLEPALSYIPTPGALPSLNAAWAGTLRGIILF